MNRAKRSEIQGQPQFDRIDAGFAPYLSQALLIGSAPFWVGMVVVAMAILLRNKSRV